jgi:hypothetical protein
VTYSSDLKKALQENLKLRRELATEVAEAKGQSFAAVRLRLARLFGAFSYALFGKIWPASQPPSGQQAPAAGPIRLDEARVRQMRQRQQPDRRANPDECRQRALECVRLAQMAKDQEARQIWSDLARTWLTFAADIEANECLLDEWGKPKPRGRKAPVNVK